MTFLGMTEDVQKIIFTILASVLHLGNITFEQSDATKGAEGSVVKSTDSTCPNCCRKRANNIISIEHRGIAIAT